MTNRQVVWRLRQTVYSLAVPRPPSKTRLSEMRKLLLDVILALEATDDLADERADAVREWVITAPGDDLLMCFESPRTMSESPWNSFRVE